MTATVHDILARRRVKEIGVAAAADFVLGPPRPFEPALLRADPAFSLFGLDPTRRAALFVDAPGGDVASHPFLYQAQRARARRLVTLAFDAWERLGEGRLPGRTTWLHHCSRCGSTLLCRMLGRVAGVRAVSEPEVFTHLVEAGLPRDRTVALARAATATLFPAEMPPAHLVVKPRHFALEIAAELLDAVPGSDAVTLYRDAEAVVSSMLRVSLGRSGLWLPRGPDAWLRPLARLAPRGPLAARAWWALLPLAERRRMLALCPLLAEDPEAWCRLGAAGLGLALWLGVLARHQALAAAGAPLRAVRYEDLATRPEATLRALFRTLSLPEAAVPAALAALPSDSQRGTVLAREEGVAVSLTASERRRIRERLASFPALSAKGARLAGTVDPDVLPPSGSRAA